MPSEIKSRIRVGVLKHVFPADELHPRIARLVVLYEDRRLETYGTIEGSIPALDLLDHKHRKIYFLRRATVTLLEFSSALSDLNGCPSFKPLKSRPTPEHAEGWYPWERAIRGFEKIKPLLKNVRNDAGGHFTLTAARHAVDNFLPQSTELVEIIPHPSEEGAACKLRFAGEIAAIGMLQQVEGTTPEEKVGQLVATVVKGHTYATAAMDTLIVNYLFDRFGR